jgi:hypothetical protein
MMVSDSRLCRRGKFLCITFDRTLPTGMGHSFFGRKTMAISVKKLEGDDVPEQYRAQGIDPVFQVQDADGELHIRVNDVEAAALAVEFSEQDKRSE